MAALLIRDAGQFDVVVTTNMFGDILSDEASEIAGSLGLAASLNAGDEHGVAQAQHGSAPDIAGKNVANPSSLIGSAAMLLAWLGERRGDESSTGGGGDRGRARPRHRQAGGRTPDSAASSAPMLRRAGGSDVGMTAAARRRDTLAANLLLKDRNEDFNSHGRSPRRLHRSRGGRA